MKKILFVAFLIFSLILCGCTDPDTDKLPDDENIEEMHDVETVPDESDILDEDILETESTPDETEQIEQVEQTEEEPEAPEHIGVTDITLTTYDVALKVGEAKMPIVTMYPQNATDKSEIWTSSDESVATVNYLGNIKAVAEGECVVTVASVDNPNVRAEVIVTVAAVNEPKPEPEVEKKPDATKVETDTDAEITVVDGCTYIDGILVVNKTYSVPADYAPGWETEASPYLWKMIEAAKKDGLTLWMKSGYRSYYDQQYIYNGYVKRDGQEEADKYSARPGHSEHQTGLAYDMNSLSTAFGDTPEGIWLAENCYKFGFILRYPKDKENITGYMYEPWHVRYVGVDKAKEIFESGLCLEEFLNITSVYS